MASHKNIFYMALASVFFLSGCDPESIDPEALGNSTSEQEQIGSFELVEDNFYGDLNSARIEANDASRTVEGSGTYTHPLLIGFGRRYFFHWSTSLNESYTISAKVYDINNPTNDGEIFRKRCDDNTCDNDPVYCYITASGGIISTAEFICTHNDVSIGDNDFIDVMVGAGLDFDSLPVDAGLKMQLCNHEDSSECDTANIAYIELNLSE